MAYGLQDDYRPIIRSSLRPAFFNMPARSWELRSSLPRRNTNIPSVKWNATVKTSSPDFPNTWSSTLRSRTCMETSLHTDTTHSSVRFPTVLRSSLPYRNPHMPSSCTQTLTMYRASRTNSTSTGENWAWASWFKTQMIICSKNIGSSNAASTERYDRQETNSRPDIS